EYHGEYVNFDPIWSYPKPVQKPHPPILMGGGGPTTFDRVVEYCDGWYPIFFTADGVAERIAELRQKAEAAGRDPDTISVTVSLIRPDKEGIEKMAAAGVSRIVFFLPPEGREKILPLLDGYAGLMS
ncbi:MAG: LLM class flavin-dependent oxidoreductase, partial [Blastocatellia bacterium]